MNRLILILLGRRRRHYWGRCWCGKIHIMPLELRLFSLSSALFVAVAMVVAFIAVVNTWRMYSLALAPAIALEVVIATIFSVSIWVLRVVIRYRDPRKPKKAKPARWPYNSFSSSEESD